MNNPKGNISFIFPFRLLLDLCENYTLRHCFLHRHITRAVMPVYRKILTTHFSLIDLHLFLLLSGFPTISSLKSNSILLSKAIKGKQKTKKNPHLNLFVFEKWIAKYVYFNLNISRSEHVFNIHRILLVLVGVEYKSHLWRIVGSIFYKKRDNRSWGKFISDGEIIRMFRGECPKPVFVK